MKNKIMNLCSWVKDKIVDLVHKLSFVGGAVDRKRIWWHFCLFIGVFIGVLIISAIFSISDIFILFIIFLLLLIIVVGVRPIMTWLFTSSRTRDDRQIIFAWIQAISMIILVLVTLNYAISTNSMAESMHDQTESIKKTSDSTKTMADTMKQEFDVGNRPWLKIAPYFCLVSSGLDDVCFDLPPEDIKSVPSLRAIDEIDLKISALNFGKQPAVSKEGFVRLFVNGNQFHETTYPSRYFMPNQKHTFKSISLNKETIEQILFICDTSDTCKLEYTIALEYGDMNEKTSEFLTDATLMLNWRELRMGTELIYNNIK